MAVVAVEERRQGGVPGVGGRRRKALLMPRWQVPHSTGLPGLGSVSWVRKSALMEAVIFIMTRARSFIGLASEAKLIASGGGIFSVAVAALDAELAGIAVHDGDDLLGGGVFGSTLRFEGGGMGRRAGLPGAPVRRVVAWEFVRTQRWTETGRAAGGENESSVAVL